MRVTLLNPLFTPESIAVCGPSGLKGGAVSTVIHSLLASGYTGKIFPVVSDCPEVCGLATFAGQDALPNGVDLAVMCFPQTLLLPALKQYARGGIRTVIALALDTTESVPEDFMCEQAIVHMAREEGITLLGPKTLGVLNTQNGVNASLDMKIDLLGNIGFFSQSASIFRTIIDMAEDNHTGFSKCVSLGNTSLVNECDLLDFFLDDPCTDLIVGYIEGVSDGHGFLRKAQNVAKKKPVIMIRPGSTLAGARSILFRSRSMLGFSAAYDAALKQAGVIRVPDIPSLLALAQGFSKQPLPQGSNVAVLTNSGSFGVMAADACEACGLDLPRLDASCVAGIRELVPGFCNVYNPVDMGSNAGEEIYARIMELVAGESRIHALLVILTPRQGIDVMGIAKAIARSARNVLQTLCVCLPGSETNGDALHFLQQQGIPCYPNPARALDTLCAMNQYRMWQRKPYPVEVCYRRDSPKIKKILDDSRMSGILEIGGLELQNLLLAYEFPVLEMKLARTAKSAAKMARKIGFPVVLKLASPLRTTDTSLRGVAIGVEDNSEVYSSFWKLTERIRRVWPETFISGCLVQKMAGPSSKEVCIRMIRDPQFGALISFSLADDGCTGQEGDVAYRLAPLSLEDAHDIIRELWAFPLLQGPMGSPRVHLRSLEDMLLTMSQLAMDCPEIIEAELSPVFVDHTQAVVGDAKIVLAPWDAIVPVSE